VNVDTELQKVYIDAANPDRFITARQGKTIVRQIAAGLQKAGLKKGECVLIASFNDVS
jgi:4-coumarate--CoA ligase